MTLKSARDEARWWALGVGILFFCNHWAACAAYPAWRGVTFPRWVAGLWLLSGSITLLLSLFTLPRWQSFVGLLVILFVLWNIVNI